MSRDIFPQTTADLAAARKKLAPHIHLRRRRDACRRRLCAFGTDRGYDRGSEDQAAGQAVIGAALTSSASIGDSDTHGRYSSLFERLRGRRLQSVANAMQLMEGKR